MHSFLNRRVKQFLCDFFLVCPPRTNLCYLLFKSFKSNEKCRHNEMRRQLFFQLVLIERVVGFNVHGCPHPSGFEHKKRLPTFCLDEKKLFEWDLIFRNFNAFVAISFHQNSYERIFFVQFVVRLIDDVL